MLNKRILRGIVVIAAIAYAVIYWFASRPKQALDLTSDSGTAAVDSDGIAPVEALDFQLPDSKNRLIKLSDFKGKPILLNFWASWCPPCVEELPSLLKLADWAGKNLGVQVVAVSVDQQWSSVYKMFKEKKLWQAGTLPLTILLSADSNVAKSYGVAKFPETFFIDRNFKVIRNFKGAQNWLAEETVRWITEKSK